MGEAGQKRLNGWAAALLGLSIAACLGLSPQGAVRKPAKPKPAKPKAVSAPVPAILKTDLPLNKGAYTEAHKALDSGNLDHALQRFCDAMAPVPAAAYTLNLVLLSDPSSVGSAVRGLRSNRKEPIFVVRKLYRGTPCYGLLLGLYSTKGEANELAASLPVSLRKARPYPAQVSVVCDLCEPPETEAALPLTVETAGELAAAPDAPAEIVAVAPPPQVAEPATVEPATPEEPEAPTEEDQIKAEAPPPLVPSPFQPLPAPVAQKQELSPVEETRHESEESPLQPPPPLTVPEIVKTEIGPLEPARTAAAPVLEVLTPSPAAVPAALRELGARPAYKEAHRLLAAGELARAVESFCLAVDEEPLGAWSLSIVLICEPKAVAAQVASLRAAVQEPVFVLPKRYNDALCYRLCIGTGPGRRQATLLRSLLPNEWAKASPFPFPLRGVCDQIEKPEPVSVAVESPKAIAGGPPVAVLPVSPTPAPAAVAPSTERESIVLPAAPVPEPATVQPSADVAKEAATALSNPEPHIEAPVSSAPQMAALAPPEVIPHSPPEKGAQLDYDPIQGEAWFQKGLAAQAKGQMGEAIEAYEQALNSQPEKPEVLNNLGVLYLQQNEFAAAKDLLYRAVSAAPGYGRARLNLSGALWGLGEHDAAVKQAQAACFLLGGDANAHLTLASFLSAVGRKSEAIAEAKVVLALEPGNRQAEQLISEASK